MSTRTRGKHQPLDGYVYIARNDIEPDCVMVGRTINLERRLKEHNNASSTVGTWSYVWHEKVDDCKQDEQLLLRAMRRRSVNGRREQFRIGVEEALQIADGLVGARAQQERAEREQAKEKRRLAKQSEHEQRHAETVRAAKLKAYNAAVARGYVTLQDARREAAASMHLVFWCAYVVALPVVGIGLAVMIMQKPTMPPALLIVVCLLLTPAALAAWIMLFIAKLLPPEALRRYRDGTWRNVNRNRLRKLRRNPYFRGDEPIAQYMQACCGKAEATD